MSAEITTTHELSSDHSSVTQDLKAVQQEIEAFEKWVNSKNIQLPVGVNNQITRAMEQTSATPEAAAKVAANIKQAAATIQQAAGQMPTELPVGPIKLKFPNGVFDKEEYAKQLEEAFSGGKINQTQLVELFNNDAMKLAEQQFASMQKVASQKLATLGASKARGSPAPPPPDTSASPSSAQETTLMERSVTAQNNAYRRLYYSTVASAAIDDGSKAAADAKKQSKLTEGGDVTLNNIGNLLGYSQVASRIMSFGISSLEETGRNMTEFSRLGRNVTSDNALETIRRTRDLANDENSGVVGMLRQNGGPLGAYSMIYGRSAEDSLRDINQATSDTERNERTFKNSQQAQQQIEQANQQILKTTDGPAAVRLRQLELWQQEEEKLANTLQQEGRKKEADMVRSRVGVLSAITTAQINADEQRRNMSLELGIDESRQGAATINRRVGGDVIGANADSARMAVRNRLQALGIAASTTQDPTERRAAQEAYNAAQSSQDSQLLEISRNEANQRAGIEKQAADQMRTIRESSNQAQLAAQGRFNEASVQSQKDALDRQITDLQFAYDHAENEAEKHAAKMALEAAKAQAPVTRAAINAAETRRQAIEATGFNEGATADGLSDQQTNFAGNRAALATRWNDRISRMESGPAKDAAMRNRDADLAAFDRNSARSIRGINTQATQANLEASGQSATAEVVGFEQDLKEQLRSAGGDMTARRAILSRAEAQAQVLARRQIRGGTFGSTDDYLQSIQQGAFSGTGSALSGIQELFKGIKGAEGAGTAAQQDAILGQSDQKFEKSVDNLLRGTKNCLILRMK